MEHIDHNNHHHNCSDNVKMRVGQKFRGHVSHFRGGGRGWHHHPRHPRRYDEASRHEHYYKNRHEVRHSTFNQNRLGHREPSPPPRDLKVTPRDLYQQNRNLAWRLASLRSKNQEQEEVNRVLEQKNRDLEAALKNKTEEDEDYWSDKGSVTTEAKVSDLEAKVSDLEEQIKDRDQDCSDLEDKCANLESLNRDFVEKVRSLEANLKALEDADRGRESEKQTLGCDLVACRSDIAGLRLELINAVDQKEAAIKQLEAVKAKEVKKTRSENQNLTKKVKLLEYIVKIKEAACQKLGSEMDAVRGQEAGLKREVEKLTGDLVEKEETLQRVSDQWKKKLEAEMVAALDREASELTAAKSDLAKYKKKYQDVDKKVRSKEAALKELEAEMEAARGRDANYESQVQKLTSDLKMNREQVKHLMVNVRSLEDSVGRKEDAYKELEDEMDDARGREIKYERQVQKLTADLVDYKKTEEEVNDLLKKVRSSEAAYKVKLGAMNDQNLNFESQGNQLTAALKDIDMVRVDILRSLEETTDEPKLLQQKTTIQLLTDLKNCSSVKIKEAVDANNALKRKLEVNRSHNRELVDKNKKVKATKKFDESKIATLEAKLMKTKADYCHVVNRRNNERKRVDIIREDQQALIDKISSLEVSLEKANAKVALTTKEEDRKNEATRMQRDDLQREVIGLNEELCILRTELEAQKLREQEITETLKDLRNKYMLQKSMTSEVTEDCSNTLDRLEKVRLKNSVMEANIATFDALKLDLALKVSKLQQDLVTCEKRFAASEKESKDLQDQLEQQAKDQHEKVQAFKSLMKENLANVLKASEAI